MFLQGLSNKYESIMSQISKHIIKSKGNPQVMEIHSNLILCRPWIARGEREKTIKMMELVAQQGINANLPAKVMKEISELLMFAHSMPQQMKGLKGEVLNVMRF